jgi:hemerythrin-like domain-containing protein
MIDPIQRFEEEHQRALGVLEELEAAARALAEGGEGGAGASGAGSEAHFAAARSAYDFLSSAIREHNENEEIALFSLLDDDVPTEPFVEDHIALRSLERRLLDAIEAQDAAEVSAAGLMIVATIRDHIDREDNLLFPLARELLGPEGLLEVSRRLES